MTLGSVGTFTHPLVEDSGFSVLFSFFKFFRNSHKDALYGVLDINRYFHNVSILMQLIYLS